MDLSIYGLGNLVFFRVTFPYVSSHLNGLRHGVYWASNAYWWCFSYSRMVRFGLGNFGKKESIKCVNLTEIKNWINYFCIHNLTRD